jgi:hypothetical protein
MFFCFTQSSHTCCFKPLSLLKLQLFLLMESAILASMQPHLFLRLMLWYLPPHTCCSMQPPVVPFRHSLLFSPVVPFSQLVPIHTCCTMQTLPLQQRHSLPDKVLATLSPYLLVRASSHFLIMLHKSLPPNSCCQMQQLPSCVRHSRSLPDNVSLAICSPHLLLHAAAPSLIMFR